MSDWHGTMRSSERATVLCASFAAFVFQFEAYLVTVSLPSIASTFSLTTTEASFIPLVYLLGATLVFIPAGRLSERVGLKNLFVTSVAMLAVGTVLCGAAPSFRLLVGGRLVQGIGVGGMAALGYALIPAHVSSDRTGSAYGTLSLLAGMGMLVGAPVGGLLAEFLSWRWIFLSNIPGMVALAVASALALPRDEPRHPAARTPFALAGVLLLGGALALGVLALSLGAELGWRSPPILLSLVLAGLLAVAFAMHERWAATPLVSREVRRGLVPRALGAVFATTMARGGTIFLIPFYLEARCGLTPTVASTALLAHALALAAVGPFAGRLADRAGAPRLAAIGALLSAAACVAFAALVATHSLLGAVLCMLVLGVGSGLFMSPNNEFTMGQAPPGHGGEVASLVTLALNTGTVAGVSAFDTILTLGVAGGAASRAHLQLGEVAATGAVTLGFAASFAFGGALFLAAAATAHFFYGDSKESAGR